MMGFPEIYSVLYHESASIPAHGFCCIVPFNAGNIAVHAAAGRRVTDTHGNDGKD